MACACGWDTYDEKGRGAKAGAAVKPVIVAQLIHLDAPLVRRLMRHRLCHHQRLGVPLRGELTIGDQVRRKFKMLLEGELGCRRLVVTEDGKRRHLYLWVCGRRLSAWTRDGEMRDR